MNGHANLTVFAYGQTGSGKTYTMEPIYAQTIEEALQACGLSRDACGLSRDDGQSTREQGPQSLRLCLSFFEIYCSKVFDLLRGRSEVRTLEDGQGQVQVDTPYTLHPTPYTLHLKRRGGTPHPNA